SRGAQHGQYISAVVVDRKALHLRIGIAFVVTEHFGRVVAGTDAGTTDGKRQLRGMKQLVKQIVACAAGKLVEHITTGIGECGAESEDHLELLIGIDNDRIVRRICRGCRSPGKRRLRCKAKLTARHPKLDFAGRSVRSEEWRGTFMGRRCCESKS